MFGRQAAGFLLILTICVLPDYGQQFVNTDPIFSISGYVRDIGDQHGVKDIRVDIKQPAGTPIGSTMTRENGAFHFSGIPKGRYVLEVKVPEYEPLRQAVEIKNSARKGVSLFLISPVKEMSAKIGASVSAHQLSAPYKAKIEFDNAIRLLYEKSDNQGAIVHFQRAIKSFPTYYEAYTEEAIAYQNSDNLPLAEEALRKSVAISSGRYSEALILLSGLLIDTNRFQEAATFARKALELDVASWRGPFQLGRALSGLKLMDEAEKNALLARDLKSDNPAIHILLANIHISQQKYASLATDLDSILHLVPDGPVADQARKTQNELQSYLSRVAEQTQRSAQGKHDASADDPADADERSNDEDSDSAIEPQEPVLSELPPLPAPSLTNR
jgi:tetratricopeptide (TPR) repeat protein